jgi:hypothetical protein
MSYQPPPNVDPPAQPANPGAREGRWAGEQETSYRLGMAGQVCGYVSIGLSGGPWAVSALFGLSLEYCPLWALSSDSCCPWWGWCSPFWVCARFSTRSRP